MQRREYMWHFRFLTILYLKTFLRDFWQVSAKGHSWVIGCISDFWQSCISKMAGCRAKQSDIWTSGVSIQCTQDTNVKLNASSNSAAIWCTSNFQQPCILKMAGLRGKHTSKSVCYPVCGHCLPSWQAEDQIKGPREIWYFEFWVLFWEV